MTRTTRPTLRLRLCILSTGLFTAAGAALLTVTYLLVAQTLPAATTAAGKGLSAQSQRCQHAIKFGPESLAAKCKAVFDAGVRQGVAVSHQQTLHHLLVYSILGLILTSLLVAVIAWEFAGRALRPLHEITATARQLSARDLDQRLRLNGPDDELKELADTFDEMLSRLNTAFLAQERFVANAAHELRTPLTIMRTEIDVTFAHTRSISEYSRMAAVLQDAIARSERLVDALLTLAYSDGRPPVTESVELAQIMHACIAERRPAARGLAIALDIVPVIVPGDPPLLEQLAANLIDNAIRHNISENGWIRVRVGDNAAGRAVIEVANSSPAIAADELDSIFEPFQRSTGGGGTARPGNGLGLSIVRSVVSAHHGTVRATSDASGFNIEVLLPRTAAQPEPGHGSATAEPPRHGSDAERRDRAKPQAMNSPAARATD